MRWRLIEHSQLEGRVIDQIRAELRGHLTPSQKAAFLGTIFELWPAGEAMSGDPAVKGPARQPSYLPTWKHCRWRRPREATRRASARDRVCT